MEETIDITFKRYSHESYNFSKCQRVIGNAGNTHGRRGDKEGAGISVKRRTERMLFVTSFKQIIIDYFYIVFWSL